jgi:hypothetical protein
MQYDPEANIISIEVAKGEIKYAHEFGNFIIHLSRANKPILIEILDGSKFVGQVDKLKEIGKINIKDMEKIMPAN